MTNPPPPRKDKQSDFTCLSQLVTKEKTTNGSGYHHAPWNCLLLHSWPLPCQYPLQDTIRPLPWALLAPLDHQCYMVSFLTLWCHYGMELTKEEQRHNNQTKEDDFLAWRLLVFVDPMD